MNCVLVIALYWYHYKTIYTRFEKIYYMFTKKTCSEQG